MRAADPPSDLVALFLSLFNAGELRAFVGRLDDGPLLLHRLPGESASLLELVVATLDLLARHGHPRGPLLRALVAAFPGRRADIDRVAAGLDPDPPPPRDRYDYGDPRSLFDGDA